MRQIPAILQILGLDLLTFYRVGSFLFLGVDAALLLFVCDISPSLLEVQLLLGALRVPVGVGWGLCTTCLELFL